MQVILPVAGFGTRLRPQTWSRPKPLVTVAGKTLIDHVLDRLAVLDLERVVFITGYLGEQIEEHVRSHYDFDAAFVNQEQQLGQSHAIYQAREAVAGPVVVMFPDMIFEADMEAVERLDVDGALFIMQVEDPSRFGVVIEEAGKVTQLVEKPEEPVSDLAVMGIYYFADAERLMSAIEYQLEHEMLTKGEFFIADAIQLMIDGGATFKTIEATVWQDAGTNAALLDTNRYLLDKVGNDASLNDSIIVPPVLIDPTATVEHSVIGPYASIGSHADVRGSIIQNSIVDTGSTVEFANVADSIIGRNAVLRGSPTRANIGDNAEISLASNGQ